MSQPKHFAALQKSRQEKKEIRDILKKRTGVFDADKNIVVKKAEEIKSPEEKEPMKKSDDKKREFMNKALIYTPFMRVNEETRTVSGIATNEAIDSYGDIVSIDAIAKALPDYLKFGNIREMHGPSAAGVVMKHELNENEKFLWIEAKIVDDNAWKKVVEGVYKGFSVGGEILDWELLMSIETDSDGDPDYSEQRTITKLELIEISLVDRPANPDAMIDAFSKGDGFHPETIFVPTKEKFAKAKNILENTDLEKNVSSVKIEGEPTTTKSSKSSFIPFSKFTVKDKNFAKAWDAVAAQFKEHGTDLSKSAESDEKVTMTKSDLTSLIRSAAQTASDTVTEAQKADDTQETPVESKTEEPVAPAETTEPVAAPATESVDSEVAKAITAAMAPLAKAMGEMSKSNAETAATVAEMKKASGATSQKDDTEIKKSENGSFQGMFR